MFNTFSSLFYDNFGVAYAINLPECADRRKAIQYELARENIPFLLVEGTDASTVEPPPSFKTTYSPIDTNIVRREFAVISTHIRILRKVLATSAKVFSVFEDDVYFIPNFQDELAEFIKHLPKDWEIAHFGPTPMPNVKLGEYISDNIIRLKSFYGSYGYACTREGAERYLNGLLKYEGNSDFTMSKISQQGGRTYCYKSPLIYHKAGYSLVTKTEKSSYIPNVYHID